MLPKLIIDPLSRGCVDAFVSLHSLKKHNANCHADNKPPGLSHKPDGHSHVPLHLRAARPY